MSDILSWCIHVNGKEMSSEVKVLRMIISKIYNKISTAKIIFIDGMAEERDFVLSNDEIFKPGNELEIKLGYDGEVDKVFKGIIIRHSIKSSNDGNSYLIIEAKDKALMLTGSRKSAYYTGKTDSDVIEEVLQSYEKEVEPTGYVHKQLVQYDATDWDFICMRAEANGMLVLTDDGKIIIKKPHTGNEAIMKAIYGDNIYEIEADIDARRQYKIIKSNSWDYTQQKLEISEAESQEFQENGNIKSDEIAEILDQQIRLSHPGHLTEDQLRSWSDAYALKSCLSKAVGRIRIKGNSDIKPGVMIKIEGIGDRFNGNVFVTGLLHTYDKVWYTDIQFGWKEGWFYNKDQVMDKSAKGLLPGVNGLVTGIVVDVDDTEDDGGEYRVKVHVPLIASSKEGIWARVATLNAGSDRGVYFSPEKEDEVVLGFLGDDPREPIILGYLYSKNKNRAPFPDKKDSKQHGIVTKAKLKLVLDDTEKTINLSVPTDSGVKSIIINDNGIMEFKDENDNSIKYDKNGIVVACGLNAAIEMKDQNQNNVKIDAKGIVMQSGVGGVIEMKDTNGNSIKIDMKGITIQSSAGVTTIKGLQVMIN